jgi:cytoskeletal protein CcmA (bactofilin family)
MMRFACTVILLALGAAAGTASAENASRTFGNDRWVAGDDVAVTGQVEGDAFLAGGRSQVDGKVDGDVVVTGGTVEIRGEVSEDVYAAGGDVRIDARVAGDARAAGGSVSLERRAAVDGNATFAGGSVDVEGRIGGTLQAFGARVAVDGEVGGDAEIASESIRIGPDARIGGRLLYRSPEAPWIAEGAVIAGGVEKQQRAWQGVSPESGVGRVIKGILRTLWFTGAVLLGIVLVAVLPVFTRQAAATVRSEPLPSIGLGMAMLVAVPFVAVILFITIIGIPLGLAVLLGYGLLLMLGYLTAALSIGDLALERVRPADSAAIGWRILFLVAALVVLALLRLVPWFGDIAVLVLFLAGVGAFTLRLLRGYRGGMPPAP